MSLLAAFLIAWACVTLLVLRLILLENPRLENPAASPSRPGLWACTHRAHKGYPWQHLFFKITPSPAFAARHPALFIQKDQAGAPYCTLGAGPRQGLLSIEFNRPTDLGDKVGFEGGVEASEEALEALVQAAQSYKGELKFSALVGGPFRGYNCNAALQSLASKSGLKLPKFTRVFMLCHGISSRLPDSAFR